jgi:hypothetical protein
VAKNASSVDASITNYLAALGTGPKTAAATKNSYSGLQTSHGVALKDFSARVELENQWWLYCANFCSERFLHLDWCNIGDSSDTTIKPKLALVIFLKSSRFWIFVNGIDYGVVILIGFFSARTNMKVDTALAFFCEAFIFLIMTADSAFTMSCHVRCTQK